MTEFNRLYRIEGFTDLWVDACLRSDEGQFKFLSLYGRDGSIMQFISALELGPKEGGVQHIVLVGFDGSRHRAEAPSTDRLGKFSTRLPKQNLFGPVNQMWIYDTSLQIIDKANRIGWVVHHESAADNVDFNALENQAWELIKSLSPVALLDHWRKPLMQWCQDRKAVQEMGSELYPRIGPIRGVRVSLSDHFLTFISESVRNRVLTPDLF